MLKRPPPSGPARGPNLPLNQLSQLSPHRIAAPCSVLWLTHVAGFISTLSTAPHRQLSFELLSQAPLPPLQSLAVGVLCGAFAFPLGEHLSLHVLATALIGLAKHGDSSSREHHRVLS